MINAVRARRILPMGENRTSIDNGCILFSGSTKTILKVDTYDRLRKEFSGKCEDLGDVVLFPSLVMAHTHLELSHTGGRTLEGGGFPAWVRSLLQNPLEQCDTQALSEAIDTLQQTGVGFVADISSRNGVQVSSMLAAARIGYLIFLEVFGFGKIRLTDEPPWPYGPGRAILDSEPEHVSAAGHALYSTSAERLQIAKSWCESRGLPFSLHLAESPEENSFLLENEGELAALFKKRILPKNFQPPRQLPVAYADSLGLLNQRTLAVHCVQITDSDAAILAERGTHVCLCPRSNAQIGVGTPPVAMLRKHGCSISLSTDGLSSCPDLNLWNELRYTREHLCEEIPLPELLAWITANPAEALGISDQYGTLSEGKLASWTTLPEDLADCL